jgi:hypothetical protein
MLSGQASWVPLLFGAGGLLLVAGHEVLLRVTREQAPRASRAHLASSVVWSFAAYASTAVFWSAPLRLTLALVVAWAVRVAFAPTREKLLAGLVYAIAGPLFESVLSSTGAFHYQHPDLLLVPAWLPALYLHVSLMTREGYLAFLRGRRAEPLPLR